MKREREKEKPDKNDKQKRRTFAVDENLGVVSVCAHEYGIGIELRFGGAGHALDDLEQLRRISTHDPEAKGYMERQWREKTYSVGDAVREAHELKVAGAGSPGGVERAHETQRGGVRVGGVVGQG